MAKQNLLTYLLNGNKAFQLFFQLLFIVLIMYF